MKKEDKKLLYAGGIGGEFLPQYLVDVFEEE